MQSRKDVFLTQTHLLELSFLNSLPSWSTISRQTDEYMYRQRNVLMPSYAPDFFVFVPYTLIVCPSAAGMMCTGSPVDDGLLHSASDMPTPETLYYQAVCASLLSVPDVIEWGHLNPSSSGPPDTVPKPHSVGGANNIPSNSPAHYAFRFTDTSPVPSAGISAAPSILPFHMTGNVSARVSGLPASSVLVTSAIVKTSPAATAPFCRSLQYNRARLAHRDAKFAVLDEKYVQREEFVTALELRPEE